MTACVTRQRTFSTLYEACSSDTIHGYLRLFSLFFLLSLLFFSFSFLSLSFIRSFSSLHDWLRLPSRRCLRSQNFSAPQGLNLSFHSSSTSVVGDRAAFRLRVERTKKNTEVIRSVTDLFVWPNGAGKEEHVNQKEEK